MAYTGNPGTSVSDQVRLELGDTDPNRPLFSDGEILFFLTQANQSVLGAAFIGAQNLVSKFSGAINETVGSVSISFGDRSKNYAMLLAQLRRRLYLEGAGVYAGGISVTDKQVRRCNGDRVPPAFSRGMLENNDSGSLALEHDDSANTAFGDPTTVGEG